MKRKRRRRRSNSSSSSEASDGSVGKKAPAAKPDNLKLVPVDPQDARRELTTGSYPLTLIGSSACIRAKAFS